MKLKINEKLKLWEIFFPPISKFSIMQLYQSCNYKKKALRGKIVL